MPIRILLVDDEPALLDIAMLFLEREALFSIETAQSGERALELLEADSFDAIVSDYQMPGMDGLSLLSQIRERGIPIPFIILTGRGREEVVIEALNLGADFYLQKGGDPKSQFAELKSKIIHAVEKRRAEEKARTAYAEMKKAVKKLEEQNRRLEESEAKFRDLADSTSVAILLYQDDRWIYANPAAEEMCGYSAVEICAMEFWGFVAPEFREMVKRRGRLRAEGGDAEKAYDFRILRKTGEEVWVHLMGSTTEYQGRTAGLISVIDITERKQMEEALREQEENYRTLLDSLSSPILIIDADDRFVGIHYNKGKLYVLPQDFIGRHCRDVLPQYIYEKHSAATTILRTTGEPQTYEYSLAIGDETRWFEASLNLRENGVTIIVVVRDITPRKQAEGALRENEARYRTLVENIPIGLIQADTAGNITYINQQIIGILGSPSREATEQINLLSHPLLREAGISNDIQTAIMEKRPFEGERKYVSKWRNDPCLSYRIAPLFNDGDVTGVLGIVEDVTIRRRADDALRLANHKLSLLSRITRHDILNDVLTAKGYLELNEADYPASVTPCLTYVEEAITRIEREVEFTQEYQELGNLPPEWQVVRQVIDEGCQQMNVPKEIRVEVDVSPLEIYADQLLTLAVSNIFRNALVHAKGMTKISVGTRETPAGELCIAIADDGSGVPKEKKEAILQPKYNRRHGHGLFLVRDILDLTGISIRETGVPGEGACFELTVPAGGWRHFMENTV
ncbi:PAS domain S-box protein [Methanogenium sp. S4BF]|uniref:PAS domain S-box protein n=1 Tax=Methanogenium sp. S4BF TaxID=1789226 RepID=UPI00241672F6|nr:PAS domain S-box protein [Methanogenium sp. S4BF]WFN33661.1 PAS domain S-box protein [Methanogenium sp. S4BF]